MRATALFISISLFLLALLSCAKIPFISRQDPLYRGLTESFADYDASVLVGRTIVIDPGHGGDFDGAVGKKKTREADVNLGVALELQRMLNNCGVNVILTRTGDTDLLSPGENRSVVLDLGRRVEISNSLEADLFISIHHNSTASGNRDYNAIETYYRMEDDGPSLDAARYVHKHMVLNLGVTENALIPGNYHVLRNNDNPSLLGEASYISNPRVEKKIRVKEKQLLEARVYLLGIIDYFSRGIPRATVDYPADGATLTSATPVIRVQLDPGVGGGGIDRSTLNITLDGETVDWSFEGSGDQLKVLVTEPLVSGLHSIEIQFRNLMGNSSRKTKVGFNTITEPAALLTRTRPARIPAAAKTPFLLEVTAVDAQGNPTVDGTVVQVTLPNSIEGSRTARTLDGTANFYLTSGIPGDHTCRLSSSSISRTVTLRSYEDVLLPLAVKFTDGTLGVTLAGVKVRVDKDQILITNRDGYVFSEGLSRGEHRITATKNGYRPYVGVINTDERGRDSGLRMLMMEPVYSGALMGKVFVIDPEGGGEYIGATGPSGTRSTDLNLRIAHKLAEHLETAGAVVAMTRTGDRSVPPDKRVALANSQGADYFISLRHDATDSRGVTPYIAHYGTSESGQALAVSIASEWFFESGEKAGVRGEYSYVLRHTPCPAISVMCSDIGTSDREERTYSGGYGMSEAYSIFSGIAALLLGTEKASLSTIRGQVQMNRHPDVPFQLEMDGWLLIPCDDNDHFVVRNVPPGEHLFKLLIPNDQRNSWRVNTETLGSSPVFFSP